MREDKLNEAAVIINDQQLYRSFNLKYLCVKLLDKDHFNMTLVNKLIKGSDEPDLIYKVITAISTRKHSKLANKMVKHYQLDMKYFPKLYDIAEENANFYMISRGLTSPEKDDHVPLYIIEDNFVGNIKGL